MNKGNREVELKFLISETDLQDEYIRSSNKVRIVQAYLPHTHAVMAFVKENFQNLDVQMLWKPIKTIRIRKEWSKYRLTIKSKREGNWCIELEHDIKKEDFERLFKLTTDVVEKDRLVIALTEDLYAQIDFYRKRYEHVVSIEVEFDDDLYKYKDIKRIVYKCFPKAVFAEWDYLRAWEMASSKDLTTFIKNAKKQWADKEILSILNLALKCQSVNDKVVSISPWLFSSRVIKRSVDWLKKKIS